MKKSGRLYIVIHVSGGQEVASSPMRKGPEMAQYLRCSVNGNGYRLKRVNSKQGRRSQSGAPRTQRKTRRALTFATV